MLLDRGEMVLIWQPQGSPSETIPDFSRDHGLEANLRPYSIQWHFHHRYDAIDDVDIRHQDLWFIPLWAVGGLFLLPTCCLWWRDFRDKGPGYCPKCGYDLTGLAVDPVCPECGGTERA